MQKYIRILTTQGISDYYHYTSECDVALGSIVSVPFARGMADGIVTGFDDSTDVPENKLRAIEGVYANLQPLSRNMIRFIERVGEYTMTPLPLVAKMVLGSHLTTKTRKDIPPLTQMAKGVKLNSEQKEALEVINGLSGFSTVLLEGVTGSGKTEVFFAALHEQIKQDKQVLILMPEIALTGNFVERFAERFGQQPLEWHSDLGVKAKRETWHAVYEGRGQVVIGARSALFLPFRNLGLVIVDEEHDGTYKQDDNVVYQARDMAVLRASIEGIPIVLSSATPSLETRINADSERYRHVKLNKRYNDAKMPAISLINMKENRPEKIGKSVGFISPKLLDEIRVNLQNKEQTLLFLNRKGYAPLVLCGSCGYRYQCPNCSSWLVQHKADGVLKCHQCNYTLSDNGVCKECKEEHTLIPVGPGIERIEAEIRHYFSEARVKLMSADNVSRKNALEHMAEISSSQVDIIIGTQVLAKGYHFPNLTLIGVVDGDMGLEGGDMRALEKTYQLLNQVSGRAGREDKEGRAFIQTYNPEHILIRSLTEGDADNFYALEAGSRKEYKLPPYASLAAIIVSATDAKRAQEAATKIASQLTDLKEIGVLGPSPAVLYRLSNRYRYRLLVKAAKNYKLASVLKEVLKDSAISSSVRVKVDINPYNFL